MVRKKRAGLAVALVLAAMLALVVSLVPKAAQAETTPAETPTATELSEPQAEAGEQDVSEQGAETVVEEAAGDTNNEAEAAVEDAPEVQAVEPRAAGNYSGSNICDDGTSRWWVLAGQTVQIEGSEWQSSSSNLLTKTSQWSDTWTASSQVKSVTTVTVGWGNNTKTVVIIPEEIDAETYLRLNNSVPYTLTWGEVADYSPNGNNNDTGYILVTVNIRSLLDKNAEPYISKENYVYFSFESADGVNKPGDDEERKNYASEYWDTYIEPSADPTDIEGLYSHFSSDNDYFGYVLKKENDSHWHIDGALKKTPPIYVVEVYENDTHQFAVTKDGAGVTGVDYGEFLSKLSELLGADANSLNLTQRSDGRSADVTYTKSGISYACTISPRYNTDKIGQASAIHPESGTFGYYEQTQNVYYVCQLNISEPVAQNGTVTISKQVTGNAADATHHYTFTLSANVNGECPVKYDGASDTHSGTVNFIDGKATLTLCDGESAAVTLPAGTVVSITEEVSGAAGTSTTAQIDQNGATPVSTPGEEVTAPVEVTVPNGTNTTVAFTNSATLQPQTGITFGSGPMLALLAVAGIGGAALVTRHVRSERRDGDAWKE